MKHKYDLYSLMLLLMSEGLMSFYGQSGQLRWL